MLNVLESQCVLGLAGSIVDALAGFLLSSSLGVLNGLIGSSLRILSSLVSSSLGIICHLVGSSLCTLT